MSDYYHHHYHISSISTSGRVHTITIAFGLASHPYYPGRSVVVWRLLLKITDASRMIKGQFVRRVNHFEAVVVAASSYPLPPSKPAALYCAASS